MCLCLYVVVVVVVALRGYDREVKVGVGRR